MIGNRSLLPFSLLLSMRHLLLHQPGPTLLAVLTLAASVALAASVEMAARSTRVAVERSARAWLGSTQLQITAADAGLDEALLERVRQVAGVAQASGVVERTLRRTAADGASGALRVLGLDLLEAGDVREWSAHSRGAAVADPVRLLAREDSLLVTPRLLADTGAREGDALALRSEHGTHRLVVRGTISGGLADAFDGQIAVMDLYALQALLATGPRLDRIDVALADGARIDDVERRLQTMLGSNVEVRRAGAAESSIDGLLGVLTGCLAAVSAVGGLLALISIHAVASLSADRRVAELAWLRAAGLEATRVRRLLLFDALVIALVATALGLGLAAVIADPLVQRLARGFERLRALEIQPLGLRPSTLAVGIGVGVPVSLLACIGPARRAAARPPQEVLRGRSAAGGAEPASRALVPGLVLALAGIASAWMVSDGVRSVAALALSFALGTAAAALLAIAAARALVGPSASRVATRAPRAGVLIATSVSARSVELGATAAVWAAIVGAVLALGTSVESIATTMDEFLLGLNGEAATLLYADDPLGIAPSRREPLSPATLDAVRATRGVVALAPYRNVSVRVRGREVALGSLPTDVLVAQGGMRTLSSDPAASAAALRRGEALMSEAFAWRTGVRIGDEIELDTPGGAQRLRVGGWARDYSGRSGSLHVDDAVFAALFGARPASFAAIWTSGDAARVQRRIVDAVSEQTLFFRDAAAWTRQTRALVGEVRDLLRLPIALIVLIGSVTLCNLLLGNVLARRHEHAMLRAAGASARLLAAGVLLQGALVAGLGALAGLGLGALWSHALCELLSRSLGWVIDLRFDPAAAPALLAATLFTAALASALPAWAATRAALVRRTPRAAS